MFCPQDTPLTLNLKGLMTNAQIKFMLGFIAGNVLTLPLLLLPASAGVRDWLNQVAWAAEDRLAPDMGYPKNKPTPLPVPQSLPPAGQTGGGGEASTIQPCAAPPPQALEGDSSTTAAQASPDVKPSDFTKELKGTPMSYDPRANVLSKLAYPQNLESIRKRIGFEDYTRAGNLEYLSGNSAIVLRVEGKKVTGYEIRQ
jgi:hypothetical protein